MENMRMAPPVVREEKKLLRDDVTAEVAFM